MLIAAIVLGVAIAGGAGVVAARHVTTRWPGQRLPVEVLRRRHNRSAAGPG